MAKKLDRLIAARIVVVGYKILCGEIVESLESYDADDGHNALVLAGIVAEMKRLEDEFEKVWPKASR